MTPSKLRSLLLCSSLLVSFATMATEGDLQLLKKSIKIWQPMEVSEQKNNITVALPSSEMTTEAYEALISSGLCTPIWTNDVPKNYLNDIAEIHVTNKHKTTGFTFESPRKTCDEMGKLMDAPAKTLLLSQTHLFKG